MRCGAVPATLLAAPALPARGAMPVQNEAWGLCCVRSVTGEMQTFVVSCLSEPAHRLFVLLNFGLFFDVGNLNGSAESENKTSIPRVMWNSVALCSICKPSPHPASLLLPRLPALAHAFQRTCMGFSSDKQSAQTAQNGTRSALPGCSVSGKAKRSRCAQMYPLLDGRVLSVHRHVFEENLRNSEAVIKR